MGFIVHCDHTEGSSLTERKLTSIQAASTGASRIGMKMCTRWLLTAFAIASMHLIAIDEKFVRGLEMRLGNADDVYFLVLKKLTQF